MIHLPRPKPSALPSPRLRWADLDKKKPGQRPPKTARAERQYARSLKGIATHVGQIIAGFEPGDISQVPTLVRLLEKYAEALTPWAARTASTMLLEVNERDRESWFSLGNAISVQLRHDLINAPIGERMRALLAEQVTLIKSLPIEAGERVHELTLKGLENSERSKAFVEEIERSGEVTTSRAVLIARTEVAGTASILTQTRAEAAGSTHYRWRTAGDHSVRPGHKAMAGKICEWANPPAVQEGDRVIRHHPGRIWNCRCWPEPIIDLH